MGVFLVLAALAVGSPLALAAESASHLNIDLRQDRFLGGVQHSAQQTNFTQMSLDLNLEPKKDKTLTYKLHSRAQGTFEAKDETYFGVPEFYGASRTSPIGVTIGRQRRTWSRLDEQFHLGVWQPELRWDYLRPEQQGLTGIFLDYRASSALKLTVFASPVNLPDQGPQYRLENGKFASSNRWFQQPSGSLGLFRGTTFASDAPLYFQIERPSNRDLFFNPSLGGGAAFDFESGYWLHANYAYKPRNQIHLGIECANCANLGAPTPLEITAVIHPKIIMHHVATLETGFERQDDRGYLSFTGEFPDRSRFPQSYEEAPLDDVLIAGGGYQHYAGSWFLGRPSWLQYSYLRVFKLGSKSNDSVLREDKVQSSLDRYPLSNVASIDWKIRLFEVGRNRLNWTTRYLYSIPEQGGWLATEFNLDQGPLTWFVGADILGSSVKPSSDKAGLFTRYRGNDRFYGGVAYVF